MSRYPKEHHRQKSPPMLPPPLAESYKSRQTCPNVSTKTELRDTPVKLVILMFRVHMTGPVQSRCPKSAIYASPCFLQRRGPELANGQIKGDCFHAEPVAHLMCSSPARPPHRIHGPARSREYRPDLPSIVAHVQGPRGRRIRRNPTSLVQAVGSSHLNCSTIRPASERSSAQPGPLAMRSADDNRPGSLWEAVCLRSVYSNSFMKCLL